MTRRVFQIGSLELQSNAFLSPLESVSCVAFRSLCFRNGAGIVWTEMIRAQAIARNNKSALDLIDSYDSSTITGVQLLAKSPSELRRALEKLEELAGSSRQHYSNIRAIDLNFGCPSPDVIREGAGPALLKRKLRMSELFSTLVSWKKNTKLNIGAVGCKIRLGLNQAEQNAKVFLPVIESACRFGLDYIVIHGRNAAQRSRDAPSYVEIAEAKKRAVELGSHIKVIANGNIVSRVQADQVMAETGCGKQLRTRHIISILIIIGIVKQTVTLTLHRWSYDRKAGYF